MFSPCCDDESVFGLIFICSIVLPQVLANNPDHVLVYWKLMTMAKKLSIFGFKPRPTVHQKGSDVDPSHCREICSDLELVLGSCSKFVIFLL